MVNREGRKPRNYALKRKRTKVMSPHFFLLYFHPKTAAIHNLLGALKLRRGAKGQERGTGKMQCAACGSNQVAGKFCGACGAPVAPLAPPAVGGEWHE